MKGGHFRYDLLSGTEGYKLRWATPFYGVECIQIIPKRLANIPPAAAYSAVYGLKRAKNRYQTWRGNDFAANLQHEAPHSHDWGEKKKPLQTSWA